MERLDSAFDSSLFLNGCQPLSNDQVYVMLNPHRQSDNETFVETFQFLEKVASSKQIEIANPYYVNLYSKLSALNLKLRDSETNGYLTQFEISLLSNLVMNDGETEHDVRIMTSFIPSLARFTDECIAQAISFVREHKQQIDEL